MSEYTCKVCGMNFPEKQKTCPRCGCPKGETVPAYLRCNRCGTVMPSKHETCPDCSLDISPQTATACMLPPEEPGNRRKQKIWRNIAIGILLVVLVGEFFLVKTIYTETSYSNAIELWGEEVAIDKNRRAPDKIVPLEVEERTDSVEEKEPTYRGSFGGESIEEEEFPEEIFEEVIEDEVIETEEVSLPADTI